MQYGYQASSRNFFPLALLVLCALSISLLTRDSAFLGDDLTLVRAGKHMAEVSFWRPFLEPWIWHEIAEDWPPATYSYFRPLVLATFAFDYLVWGFQPLGYLITNALLHAANTLLVFHLALRLFSGHIHGRLPALLAGAFFALNPGQVFTVLWISARTDSLCALFYLAAVILFTKSLQENSRSALVLSTLFTVLAILSKEMAYTVPVACLATFAILRVPERPYQAWMFAALRSFGPHTAVAAALFLSRWAVLDPEGVAGAFTGGLEHRAHTVLREWRALLIPFDVPLKAYLAEHPFIVLLGFVAGSFLLWPLRVRIVSGITLYSVVWIVATLLPVMDVYNPWYLYLPSVGVALGAGWILGAHAGGRAALAGATAAVIMLAAYTAELNARAISWTEAGRIANAIASDFDRHHDGVGVRPIFLSMPGELEGIPLYNHNLDARLRIESGHPGLDSSVAGYLSVPVDVDEHDVRIVRADTDEWIVEALDKSSYFIFPSYPQDEMSREWGSYEVEESDERGLPRALRIRLHDHVPQERPLFYYSRGRLLPVETDAPDD